MSTETTTFNAEAFAKMSPEEQLAYVKRLAEEKTALEQANAKRKKGELTFEVSEKGALMVKGLQRFPVTLYLEQWEKLLNEENVKRMVEFISLNRHKFSVLTEEQKQERREAKKVERAEAKKVEKLAEAKRLVQEEEARQRGEEGRANTINPR